jgi:hypothetical protein
MASLVIIIAGSAKCLLGAIVFNTIPEDPLCAFAYLLVAAIGVVAILLDVYMVKYIYTHAWEDSFQLFLYNY